MPYTEWEVENELKPTAVGGGTRDCTDDEELALTTNADADAMTGVTEP